MSATVAPRSSARQDCDDASVGTSPGDAVCSSDGWRFSVDAG
jgi:hypothetical protein